MILLKMRNILLKLGYKNLNFSDTILPSLLFKDRVDFIKWNIILRRPIEMQVTFISK